MSMNAMLAARAHVKGRAQRSSLLRHREIIKRPIGLVFWELGAEPYVIAAAAIGRFGSNRIPLKVAVPGQPLVRDLLFAALTPFAQQFCKEFEAYMTGPLETINEGKRTVLVPRELPQIIVPNDRTVDVMSRLGRRLAYLPIEGEYAANPVLVRMGRHFQWLSSHFSRPGSQLVLAASKLLRENYVVPVSEYEAGSLAVLDAWIEPSSRGQGFEDSVRSEGFSIGPAPDPRDGEEIAAMMERFNRARGGLTDPETVAHCIGEIRARYVGLVGGTWALTQRAIDRERQYRLAASVQRRVLEDRKAYVRHMEWMNSSAGGRRRARMTYAQAIRAKDELETEQARVVAEEAIDDPVRMIPQVLAGKAFEGKVVSVDAERLEKVNTKFMRRPVVVVQTDEFCEMPEGCKVWWTEAPGHGLSWLVAEVQPSRGGCLMTLILGTSSLSAQELPQRGGRVRFTQLGLPRSLFLKLPKEPWTHRVRERPTDDHLEGETDLPIRDAA